MSVSRTSTVCSVSLIVERGVVEHVFPTSTTQLNSYVDNSNISDGSVSGKNGRVVEAFIGKNSPQPPG